MKRKVILVLLVLFLLTQGAGAREDLPLLSGTSRFTPYQIILSLEEAYPGVVTGTALREGDLSFFIRGEKYFWAGGRLLPGDLRSRDDYASYPFYSYSGEYKPSLPELSPAQEDALEKLVEAREADETGRYTGFYDLLYRLHDEQSAWAMMKTTYFLGHKVSLHRDLLEDLARVEETLEREKLHDGELAAFIEDIQMISGFNWRTIASSGSRSNHSYGMAVDIIPEDYGDKQAYWYWSRQDKKWYRLPWEERFVPPESFIRAFENQGFIWGGKWLFYDTIHFEYRPEILLLNGISVP